MNILVTGTSGFVGLNLLNYFNEKGYVIDVIDLGQFAPWFVRTAYHWSDIDAVYFNEYDAVIHLAGKAHDTRGNSLADEYFKVNVGLTKIIFDKFLDSRVANFIYFSSVKAIADVVLGEVLTEDALPNPVGPYGQSKLVAENYIREQMGGSFSCNGAKRVYILRPCMIHGPGNKGNLNLLYKVVKWGLPWPLGSFDNLRSFTSIGNLEFIVGSIIKGDVESGVYNISDDAPISTNRLIELIGDSLGKRTSVWRINSGFMNGLARIGDVLHLPLNSLRLQKLTESYVVSNAKLKSALGVESLPVSAEEGMMLTLKSFKDV